MCWWFLDETISKSANEILEIKRISNEFKFFNCKMSKMCLALRRWERLARFLSGEERGETDVFAGYVDRVFWGVCCERIISVNINWCRFFILLLIIYSGFHTEPWAVIFSDNAWQRQQNILKKLTKQPACTITSFNSNSKYDSLCSWKVAFFRFQNIILSLLLFFFILDFSPVNN